jgi:thioredoxin-related protein
MKNSSTITVLLISCLISISSVLAFDTTPKKTLLIFSADWCHYCKVAQKDMTQDIKLSEMIKNYDIIELDYDVDKDVVNGYNIKVVPSFVIMHQGKELGRKAGYDGSLSLYNFLK